MKITLQPLKVEDWLGRKFVRGLYVTQEMFQTDMLNRILVELCAEGETGRVRGFMHHMREDARCSPLYDEAPKLDFDGPTLRAFEACVQAGHPVLALSLLRLARTENLIIALCHDKFGRGMGEEMQVVKAEHMDGDLKVGLHVGGKPVGRMSRVFKLTGKQLLAETPMADWSCEFLTIPYAVEAGLLLPARVILAKCHAVRALEKLYSDKMLKDGYVSFSIELSDRLEAWRYEHLFRQTQFACIELAGFINVQHGLSRGAARDFMHRDWNNADQAA